VLLKEKAASASLRVFGVRTWPSAWSWDSVEDMFAIFGFSGADHELPSLVRCDGGDFGREENVSCLSRFCEICWGFWPSDETERAQEFIFIFYFCSSGQFSMCCEWVMGIFG